MRTFAPEYEHAATGTDNATTGTNDNNRRRPGLYLGLLRIERVDVAAEERIADRREQEHERHQDLSHYVSPNGLLIEAEMRRRCAALRCAGMPPTPIACAWDPRTAKIEPTAGSSRTSVAIILRYLPHLLTVGRPAGDRCG